MDKRKGKNKIKNVGGDDRFADDIISRVKTWEQAPVFHTEH